MTAAAKPPKPINLALQGGGGHGAFTWGVLDRLIESGHLSFGTISATSGGAMNAVVMLDGLEHGGPDRAREKLETFWRRISQDSAMMASADAFIRAMHRQWLTGGFSHEGLLAAFARFEPPEAFSALKTNPLQPILDSLVDFDRLHRSRATRLFVSATNVRTGKSRTFAGREVTCEAIMASGCLPYLFGAVEIDGAAYWDGGYSCNPTLSPFFLNPGAQDILLVQLYPRSRGAIPTRPEKILDRMNEITFDNSLIQELYAIDFVNRLAEDGQLGPARYEPHRLHRIEPTVTELDHSETDWTDNSWPYFMKLRDAGRRAAGHWLDKNLEHVGVRGTFDLRAEFRESTALPD